MMSASPPKTGFQLLDFIERLGNKLPEPAILFAVLAGLIIVISGVASAAKWQVQPMRLAPVMVAVNDPEGKPILDDAGKPKMQPVIDTETGTKKYELQEFGTPLVAQSLMTGDGVYWMLSSMVRNFTGLPALGLVFVAMLGIGLAEKFGMFSALMRALALITPAKFLTPMVVFVGANSSIASDAGYIILPPLAAALYLAVGRHPIAGLAAAFAGVAGGFGGGVFPTAADGFLAGVATSAAQIIDPTYSQINPLHNFYFKTGSALIVMLCGWIVTDLLVEPRLKRKEPISGGDTSAIEKMALEHKEKFGLWVAGGVAVVVLTAFFSLVLVKGAPLYGVGMSKQASGGILTESRATFHVGQELPEVASERVLAQTKPETLEDGTVTEGWMVEQQAGSKASMLVRVEDRWAQSIVPLIFFVFLLPGMAYGIVTGVLRTQQDFIEAVYHGVRSIVPVLTIAFFMGQFVNYFQYSGLDRMLAFAGGQLLMTADLPVPLLICLFVLVVVAGDFAMSGMLSKFGVMAPIFIPMFMMVGMSPELTTAAYRIGDSVVNIITPLNSYLLIILVVLQKYKKGAGLGNLISLMLPYSIVFGVVWTAVLLGWWWSGYDLGVKAGLTYQPG